VRNPSTTGWPAVNRGAYRQNCRYALLRVAGPGG
jgi:hypothetical protein